MLFVTPIRGHTVVAESCIEVIPNKGGLCGCVVLYYSNCGVASKVGDLAVESVCNNGNYVLESRTHYDIPGTVCSDHSHILT